MKTPGASSAVDAGTIAGPRHQAGAKHHAKGDKFEKTIADTALRQHHHQSAKVAAAERQPRAVTGSSGSADALHVDRMPRQRAWQSRIPEAAVGSTSEAQQSESATAGSETAVASSSASTEQPAPAASVIVPWPNPAVAGIAKLSEVLGASTAPAPGEPAPQRKLVSSLVLDAGQSDETDTVEEAAVATAAFPSVTVLGQETHMAPSRSSGGDRRLEEPAIGAMPHSNGRAVPMKSEAGSRNAEPDEPGVREPAVTAASGRGVSTDAESAARPILSPPAAQVIDALIGRSEQVGELPSRPVSSLVRLDEQQPPSPLVRTLKLQLTPESLGLVNVIVVRGETSLRIRLEAEAVETRGALLADRDTIGRQLEASGLRVDELVVMRPTDSGNSAVADQRSATASGWANEANSGHRSEQGQQRQPGRTWAGEPANGPKTEEATAAQTEAAAAASGDRFLGRRALRSV